MATKRKKCFVIMPFSTTTAKHTEQYWTELFTRFIKPSVESCRYDCFRSQARPQSIIKGIVGDLFNADLVLAVLTDLNPNVWYELGVRHSIKHGTIMVMEHGQTLPFDIRQYGVIFYRDNKVPDFRSELGAFIDRIKASESDNPVRDHLPVHLVPAAVKGVRRIAEKNEFNPDFWNNDLLAKTSHTLDLLGHSLSKWLSATYRTRFIETLKRLAENDGHVRMLVMKPDSSPNAREVRKTLKTVFEDVKQNLPQSRSKRISVRWVAPPPDIPYMLIRTDNDIVVSPYFATASSEKALLVVLQPNTEYAEQYVNDFQTLFDDHAEDATWPLPTP